MIRLTLLLWSLAGIAFPATHSETTNLAQAFLHPPDSAKPWVNWFWKDGNITREGITADLEAMQRVGIGGALLMDVTQHIPRGPIRFASPEWRELFRHTLAEAHRLGLQINLHNAPGWSGSGGPWITPELAMQKVVWTKTNVVGPAHFDGLLPPLLTVRDFSRDIATVAFSALVGDGAKVPNFSPKLTASVKSSFNGTNLLDGNPATFVGLPIPKPSAPQYIQLEFAEPFTAAYLKLTGVAPGQTFQGVLQVSDNGRRFRDVRPFSNNQSDLLLNFEQVSVRYYRMLFTQAEIVPKASPLRKYPPQLEFSELELTPVFRIELAQAKAGLGRAPPSSKTPPAVPDYALIHRRDLIDLSSKKDAQGHLSWDVPPGQWTIMRFGHTPTGRENHPVPPEGSGLECDKLSKQAIETHFRGFLGELIDNLPDQSRSSLAATHIDSWENGYQNWTAQMPDEFRKRRGYDPISNLPAISGRIVESTEVSERFFWDLRRTIAELWADNYAGHLAELAQKHHMTLSIEAYANGPFDQLLYASRADVPMSEFWAEQDDNSRFQTSKTMASAAHTYGKPVVAAEAFTAYPADAKWQNHPFSLKPLSDAAFCEGVNRLVFHRYAHQPWPDRKPGMTMGPWGIHYERTVTWWEQSTVWHQYLARCQFLLQQGLFVADLCYLTDEGAYCDPPTRAQLQPPLPPGYEYDLAAPEVVLHRLSVAPDGRLLLPDGMTYRALVLPANTRMTPQLLTRLKALVEADGATVVGPRPAKSPSLAGFPECDRQVQDLADALWRDCDGKTVLEHRLGNGKIIWGKPLKDVLTDSGAGPDFIQATPIAGHPLRWIHRRLDEADIYFVANSNSYPIRAECAFRVIGKRPEVWHPDKGEVEQIPTWRENTTNTIVPINLDAAGSAFVVFRESTATMDPVSSVLRDQKPDTSARISFDHAGNFELIASNPGNYEIRTASGKKSTARLDDVPKAMSVTGPWELEFPSNAGAPRRVTLDKLISWSAHTNVGVKYFSGTATYHRSLQIPPELIAKDLRLWLDLGVVQVIAQIKLNDQPLGTFWKPPFRANLTSAAKPGDNQLEISVVNLWPNRLIGDEQLPDDCQWRPADSGHGGALAEWPQWLLQNKPSPTGRLTFATWKYWTKDSTLLPSGLLGPVKLEVEKIIKPQ